MQCAVRVQWDSEMQYAARECSRTVWVKHTKCSGSVRVQFTVRVQRVQWHSEGETYSKNAMGQ